MARWKQTIWEKKNLGPPYEFGPELVIIQAWVYVYMQLNQLNTIHLKKLNLLRKTFNRPIRYFNGKSGSSWECWYFKPWSEYWTLLSVFGHRIRGVGIWGHKSRRTCRYVSMIDWNVLNVLWPFITAPSPRISWTTKTSESPEFPSNIQMSSAYQILKSQILRCCRVLWHLVFR